MTRVDAIQHTTNVYNNKTILKKKPKNSKKPITRVYNIKINLCSSIIIRFFNNGFSFPLLFRKFTKFKKTYVDDVDKSDSDKSYSDKSEKSDESEKSYESSIK